jgi:hypothetical protein
MEAIMLKYCAALLIVFATNSYADEAKAPQAERKIFPDTS